MEKSLCSQKSSISFSWKFSKLSEFLIVVVQSLSHVRLFAMDCRAPGFPVLHHLPGHAQIHESMMPSNHLILCCTLLPPSVFPRIRVFPNESVLCLRWPNIGVSASASYPPKKSQGWSPSEWTGWISLQSKGLSRVFSNTSSKASILPHSAFFMVQLSHPYVTAGKTIALTRWTFVGKVMPLFLMCYLGLSKLFFQGASVF